MSEQTPRAPRIDFIDGLRGYAILAVIFGHVYVRNTNILIPWGYHGIWLHGLKLSVFTFFTNFHEAIPLFFILSGFVLFLPFALNIREMKSWQDAKKFYFRRARRLFPLYLINIFLFATLLRVDALPRDTVKNLFFLLTFLFPFFHSLQQPIYNPVLWSLGVEAWFSLLLPLIIVCIRRYGFGKVMFTFIAFALILSFWRTFQPISTYFWHTNGVGVRLRDFVFGMFLAHLCATQQLSVRGWKWLVMGILIVSISFLFSDAFWMKLVPTQLAAVTNLTTPLGFSFIIYEALSVRWSVFHFLLANWPIQLCGMMCYSLYVWHSPAIVLQPAATLVRLIRYLFLVFATSFVSYRFIEFGSVKDWRSLLPRRPGKANTVEHLNIVSS
ncbi:MAG: acyltransferase [Candidatus Peribacteraceae bacterium]|nr:acyltransferase [Candidatus Peribacteraceae bacterium]